MQGRFVSYLRVSTDKQGKSGLGLEAQRDAVQAFLNGGDWKLMGEYVEIETGKDDDRPELAKALARCKLTGSTLIVAKLDRLSRNSRFLMSIYEGSGEAGVTFCDLPAIPPGSVGKFLVQQMANVAELERGLISERTKAALKVAKAKGKVLGGFRGYLPDHTKAAEAHRKAAHGFAADVAPMVLQWRENGLSLRQIAEKLTSEGIRTRRGGAWSAATVKAILDRMS